MEDEEEKEEEVDDVCKMNMRKVQWQLRWMSGRKGAAAAQARA